MGLKGFYGIIRYSSIAGNLGQGKGSSSVFLVAVEHIIRNRRRGIEHGPLLESSPIVRSKKQNAIN